MSVSNPTEAKPNKKLLQAVMKEVGAAATGGAPSSSSSSFPPLPPHTARTLEDSDEDMFTVPDVEGTAISPSLVTNPNSNNKKSNVADPHLQTGFPGKRRRGRNPVDKEYRRLKRLLRNRVSAQQARERKKVYVNELESRAKEMEDKNSKLEERISTLINENTMLRKILMNTRPKVDDSTES